MTGDGCIRSSGLNVVDDVGKDNVVEDAEAGADDRLVAIAQEVRAVGDTCARSPLAAIGLLFQIAGRGWRREAGDIREVDTGIRSAICIKRRAVVLVTESEIDAEVGKRTVRVLDEVVL